MKTIWSEWDIGSQGLVFKTEAAARRWLEDNEQVGEIIADSDGDFSSLQDIIDAGLIGLDDVEVVE